MNKKLLILPLILCFPLFVASQGNRISASDFINTYRQIAIDEMNLHGIPASIKMAQAILESGFGNSDLARNANNFFGIKCSGWQGRTYFKDDDKPNECFRAYNSAEESFRDHSQFLRTRAWYAPLFDLKLNDYKGWAVGLQRAGYATNPNYSSLLVRIIEEHNLHELDKLFGVAPGNQQISTQPDKPVETHQTNEVVLQPVVVSDFVDAISREVEVNNRIKYVIARRGDTPESIGREFNKQPRHIIEYNELGEEGNIEHGQIIYLQPKRNRGDRAFHIVQPGETIYGIAQQYGIKLQVLLDKNKISSADQILVGTRISLR